MGHPAVGRFLSLLSGYLKLNKTVLNHSLSASLSPRKHRRLLKARSGVEQLVAAVQARPGVLSRTRTAADLSSKNRIELAIVRNENVPFSTLSTLRMKQPCFAGPRSEASHWSWTEIPVQCHGAGIYHGVCVWSYLRNVAPAMRGFYAKRR